MREREKHGSATRAAHVHVRTCSFSTLETLPRAPGTIDTPSTQLASIGRGETSRATRRPFFGARDQGPFGWVVNPPPQWPKLPADEASPRRAPPLPPRVGAGVPTRAGLSSAGAFFFIVFLADQHLPRRARAEWVHHGS